MKRYTSRIINLAGQSCQVNIYDDNYTGDVVELLMSPDPIRISESAQDLLTEPIMASSAVLTFISDPALEGLVVEDEMQCTVEVLADDILVWHGYLNPEVRDDLLPSITSEVTLNATSTLGLMSTRKISAEGEPLQSIAAYIVEALQACGNVLTDICLPSVAKITESDGYNSLWTLQAQRDNFYTREEITSTDDEMYDEQSWADVLSNFMTLFGLTMMEDYASGCIMLLSRDADATYCRMTLEDFVAGIGVESYALPDSADMASLPMWGTSHSTSTYAPVNKVKVVSNINSMDLNIIGDNTYNGNSVIIPGNLSIAEIIGDKTRRYRYYGSRVICPISGNLTLLAYSTQNDQVTGALITKQIINPSPRDIEAHLTGPDGDRELNIGGAIVIEGPMLEAIGLDPAKVVEDRAKTILLRNYAQSASEYQRLSLPEGTDLIRYKDDNFLVNYAGMLGLYARFYGPAGQISPIKIILRAGEKYYNGLLEWVDNPVYFTPTYKKIDDQRWEITETIFFGDTYDLDFEGLRGEKILCGGLTQRKGIDIIVSINDEWVGNTKNQCIMYDFELKFAYSRNLTRRNIYTGDLENSINSIAVNDNGGKDMDSINVNIHSDQRWQPAKSYLWNGLETISSLVYGGTTQIPEQWLANHLKSIYCRSRKRYKLTVEGIDYKTNTRYNYEDITYTTVARSVDPYNNTTTLTLERATKNANL